MFFNEIFPNFLNAILSNTDVHRPIADDFCHQQRPLPEVILQFCAAAYKVNKSILLKTNSSNASLRVGAAFEVVVLSFGKLSLLFTAGARNRRFDAVNPFAFHNYSSTTSPPALWFLYLAQKIKFTIYTGTYCYKSSVHTFSSS